MSKCKQVMMTHSELQFLYRLVTDKKESGEYYGNREHYLRKQDLVFVKIKQALSTKTEKTRIYQCANQHQK